MIRSGRGRTSRPLVVLASAVAAFIVTACGVAAPTTAPATGGPVTTAGAPGATTSPGSPAGGTTKAACDLLSDGEIQDITGSTVAEKDPEPADTVYANVCRWTFDGPGEMDLGVLDVDAPGFFERTVEMEGGTEITGLGDRAIRTELTGALLTLTGDTMLDLFTLSTGWSDAVEEALVERVLENLGG